jgi:hypothetical protein
MELSRAAHSTPLRSTAAFVAVGLGVHLALLLAYDFGVQAKTVDAQQKQYFESFEGAIRVLVVGASHSRSGFDTRLTDDAFVYAFPGEGYSMIYYRLLHALERHPEVEHVIAPIGPYYFSDRGEPYPQEWIGFREAFRYGEAGGDTWGYLKEAFRNHIFPYAGKHQMTWDFLNSGRERAARHDIVRGFQPSHIHMPPAQMRASAEEIVAAHYTGATDPIHANYLERLAALCAERGLHLTLVDWPVSAIYSRLAEGKYDPAVQAAALARARTHLPIEVVDLSTTFHSHDELFGNSDHVNAEGAYLATRMILEQAGLPIRADVTAPLPAPRERRDRQARPVPDGAPAEAAP